MQKPISAPIMDTEIQAKTCVIQNCDAQKIGKFGKKMLGILTCTKKNRLLFFFQPNITGNNPNRIVETFEPLSPVRNR